MNIFFGSLKYLNVATVLAILAAVSLIGCAAHSKIIATGELHEVFKQYTLSTNNTKTQQSAFFTAKMWKDVQEFQSNSKNKTNPSTGSINNFPNELKVENTLESIEGNNGCLIVQGKNHNGEMMDYSISFVMPKGRWLIANITVTLYDPGQKRWLTKPVCDVKRTDQLWLEHVQREYSN